MPTKVQDLVTRLRAEILDDVVGAVETDYRWQTADIVAALSFAQRELARRLLLLIDSTTTALCNITVVAGTRSYALSPLVIQVDRVEYPGRVKALLPLSAGEMDILDPGWTGKTGTPATYVTDYHKDMLTLGRQPTAADGTIKLTVRKYPADLLLENIATQEVEIINLDNELLHGAASVLYRKDDRKTFDSVRANNWATIFENDIRQRLGLKLLATGALPPAQGNP